METQGRLETQESVQHYVKTGLRKQTNPGTGMKNSLRFGWMLGLIVPLTGCVVSPQPPSPPPAVPGASQTLSEVFLHLQLDYSDRNSLDPKTLITSVLRELEREFAELELHLHASLEKAQIRLRSAEVETLLPIANPVTLEQAYHALQRLAQALRDSSPPHSPQRVELALARGLSKALDPYSVWMPQAAFREFRSNVTGEYAGLGVVVGLRESQLEVIELMDGGPAKMSGIKPGDRFVKIGTAAVAHMTQEEILRRLRGKAGTMIALEMSRPGVDEPIRFELVRAVVESPSVEVVDLQETVGKIRLLRLERFQQGTAEEVQAHLQGLTRQDGLILDLRGNPGGILEAATEVADLLLPGGLEIVSTQGALVPRGVKSRHRLDPEAWRTVPLVVLVNNASASASEVLAAALQQHKRGVVLGQRTYGKGTIQTTWPHQDGSGLKLTIGQYLTPDGSSLHSIGVIPDVALVPVHPDTEQFVWWSPDELDPPSSSGKPTVFAHRLRLLSKPPQATSNDPQPQDNTITLAWRLLQQARQSGTLPAQALADLVKQARHEQETEFTKAMAVQNIDWSLPAEAEIAPEVSARLQVQRRSPAALELHLTVRNDSAHPVHRVVGVLHSPLETIDQRQWGVGRIPGGGTCDLTLTLPLFRHEPTYTAPIRLKLLDHSGKKIGEVHTLVFPVPTRKLALGLSMDFHEDGNFGSVGNGNGQPDPGETLALKLRVENTAAQTLGAFTVELHDRTGNVRIHRGHVKWEVLDSGQVVTETLRLAVPDPEWSDEPLRLLLRSPAFPDTQVTWQFSLSELAGLRKAEVPAFKVLAVDHDSEAQDSGQRWLRFVPKNRAQLQDIVVFLNGHKVRYQLYETPENAPPETVLELVGRPGLNRLEVLLRGKSGLTLRRTLRFWQPQVSGSS